MSFLAKSALGSTKMASFMRPDSHDGGNLADLSLSANEWFSLAHKAKEEGLLKGYERKFLFGIGLYAGRALVPSAKQLRLAWRLHNKMLGKI
jgi:hypothetical protein